MCVLCVCVCACMCVCAVCVVHGDTTTILMLKVSYICT